MASYQFGPYCLSSDLTLWCRGRMVPLAPMQRRLLACLCEQGGRVISKNDLILMVWGHAQTSDLNLARTRHGLRRKLASADLGRDLIQTVYGQGYVFTQPVQALPETADAMRASLEPCLA